MKKIFIAAAVVAAAAALSLLFFTPIFKGEIIVSPWISFWGVYLRWYGITLGLAIFSAYFFGRKQAWRFGISPEAVDQFAFWLVIFCFLSARIYFVLFDWRYFISEPGQIYQIWRGGLSIYGALLGGIIFTVIYARGKAFSLGQLLDLTSLVLPLGQAIGRFGNFFNYEAFGRPTSLPWRMFVPAEFRPSVFMGEEYFHPVFLYESLGSLFLLLLLFRARGKMRPGSLALVYLAVYSVLRFFLEYLRLDSVFVGEFPGGSNYFRSSVCCYGRDYSLAPNKSD